MRSSLLICFGENVIDSVLNSIQSCFHMHLVGFIFTKMYNRNNEQYIFRWEVID